jgi:hypothetical protein
VVEEVAVAGTVATMAEKEAVKGPETEAKMEREKVRGAGAKVNACRAFQSEPEERAGLTAVGVEAAKATQTVEARDWEEEARDSEEEARDWEGEARGWDD